MDHSSQEFIEFALKKQVLQFGQFKTKAGRLSPYFFNTGLFNDGESLMKLGMFMLNLLRPQKFHLICSMAQLIKAFR